MVVKFIILIIPLYFPKRAQASPRELTEQTSWRPKITALNTLKIREIRELFPIKIYLPPPLGIIENFLNGAKQLFSEREGPIAKIVVSQLVAYPSH